MGTISKYTKTITEEYTSEIDNLYLNVPQQLLLFLILYYGVIYSLLSLLGVRYTNLLRYLATDTFLNRYLM